MYLEIQDIFVACLAMVLSTTLVFTTAFKNWKLEESARYWRTRYFEEISK